MKHLLLAFLLISQFAFGVTANKVWRIPSGGTLPAWGPVNLADGTNAITGALASKSNLPSVGPVISGSSGSFSSTSTTPTLVTNFSNSITTTGRPVVITAIPDGTVLATAAANFAAAISTGATNTAASFTLDIYILRDGSNIAETSLQNSCNTISGGGSCEVAWPPSALWYLDTAASATTHVYSVKTAITCTGLSVTLCNSAVQKMELLTYEL